MQRIVLPRPAFENRHPFVRNGVSMAAVAGFSAEGRCFIRIEETATVGGLPVRWIPKCVEITSNENGEFNLIVTKWTRQQLDLEGNFNKVLEDDVKGITNAPDLISFSASLGLMMQPSVINGFVRDIKGFDEQPLFA